MERSSDEDRSAAPAAAEEPLRFRTVPATSSESPPDMPVGVDSELMTLPAVRPIDPNGPADVFAMASASESAVTSRCSLAAGSGSSGSVAAPVAHGLSSPPTPLDAVTAEEVAHLIERRRKKRPPSLFAPTATPTAPTAPASATGGPPTAADPVPPRATAEPRSASGTNFTCADLTHTARPPLAQRAATANARGGADGALGGATVAAWLFGRDKESHRAAAAPAAPAARRATATDAEPPTRRGQTSAASSAHFSGLFSAQAAHAASAAGVPSATAAVAAGPGPLLTSPDGRSDSSPSHFASASLRSAHGAASAGAAHFGHAHSSVVTPLRRAAPPGGASAQATAFLTRSPAGSCGDLSADVLAGSDAAGHPQGGTVPRSHSFSLHPTVPAKQQSFALPKLSTGSFGAPLPPPPATSTPCSPHPGAPLSPTPLTDLSATVGTGGAETPVPAAPTRRRKVPPPFTLTPSAAPPAEPPAATSGAADAALAPMRRHPVDCDPAAPSPVAGGGGVNSQPDRSAGNNAHHSRHSHNGDDDGDGGVQPLARRATITQPPPRDGSRRRRKRRKTVQVRLSHDGKTLVAGMFRVSEAGCLTVRNFLLFNSRRVDDVEEAGEDGGGAADTGGSASPGAAAALGGTVMDGAPHSMTSPVPFGVPGLSMASPPAVGAGGPLLRPRLSRNPLNDGGNALALPSGLGLGTGGSLGAFSREAHMLSPHGGGGNGLHGSQRYPSVAANLQTSTGFGNSSFTLQSSSMNTPYSPITYSMDNATFPAAGLGGGINGLHASTPSRYGGGGSGVGGAVGGRLLRAVQDEQAERSTGGDPSPHMPLQHPHSPDAVGSAGHMAHPSNSFTVFSRPFSAGGGGGGSGAASHALPPAPSHSIYSTSGANPTGTNGGFGGSTPNGSHSHASPTTWPAKSAVVTRQQSFIMSRVVKQRSGVDSPHRRPPQELSVPPLLQHHAQALSSDRAAFSPTNEATPVGLSAMDNAPSQLAGGRNGGGGKRGIVGDGGHSLSVQAAGPAQSLLVPYQDMPLKRRTTALLFPGLCDANVTGPEPFHSPDGSAISPSLDALAAGLASSARMPSNVVRYQDLDIKVPCGEGASASVFVAIHLPTGRRLAVKRVDLSALCLSASRHRSGRQHFLQFSIGNGRARQLQHIVIRELQVLHLTYRSPFMVKVYNAFYHPERDVLDIVMEFMHYGSLDTVVTCLERHAQERLERQRFQRRFLSSANASTADGGTPTVALPNFSTPGANARAGASPVAAPAKGSDSNGNGGGGGGGGGGGTAAGGGAGWPPALLPPRSTRSSPTSSRTLKLTSSSGGGGAGGGGAIAPGIPLPAKSSPTIQSQPVLNSLPPAGAPVAMTAGAVIQPMLSMPTAVGSSAAPSTVQSPLYLLNNNDYFPYYFYPTTSGHPGSTAGGGGVGPGLGSLGPLLHGNGASLTNSLVRDASVRSNLGTDEDGNTPTSTNAGGAEPVEEAIGVAERVVAVVGEQLLRGVRDMHERNYIHRDIKPGNVLINEHGVVKLSDFGLSQKCDRRTGVGIRNPQLDPLEAVSAAPTRLNTPLSVSPRLAFDAIAAAAATGDGGEVHSPSARDTAGDHADGLLNADRRTSAAAARGDNSHCTGSVVGHRASTSADFSSSATFLAAPAGTTGLTDVLSTTLPDSATANGDGLDILDAGSTDSSDTADGDGAREGGKLGQTRCETLAGVARSGAGGMGAMRGASGSPSSSSRDEEDVRCSGTDKYMSPERQRGEPHGKPSDVWAVGVTLAEFALGFYPYDLDGCTDEFERAGRMAQPVDIAFYQQQQRDMAAGGGGSGTGVGSGGGVGGVGGLAAFGSLISPTGSDGGGGGMEQEEGATGGAAPAYGYTRLHRRRFVPLSSVFADFIRLATLPVASERPTAQELLEHPFFRQWSRPFNLKDYLASRVLVPSNAYKEEYNKRKREKAQLAME